MSKKKSFEEQQADLKKAAEVWNKKKPAEKKAARKWGKKDKDNEE